MLECVYYSSFSFYSYSMVVFLDPSVVFSSPSTIAEKLLYSVCVPNRAVARFLYLGGKLGQYKFINRNYYTKFLNCIENFKAFLRVLKTINMSIILESFAIF